MAKVVLMRHKETGLIQKGFIGFSWTTLFFGPIPSLFRLDFLTFLGSVAIFSILAWADYGVLGPLLAIAWAFVYNRYYTRRLMEKGYRLLGDSAAITEASERLGIA